MPFSIFLDRNWNTPRGVLFLFLLE